MGGWHRRVAFWVTAAAIASGACGRTSRSPSAGDSGSAGSAGNDDDGAAATSGASGDGGEGSVTLPWSQHFGNVNIDYIFGLVAKPHGHVLLATTHIGDVGYDIGGKHCSGVCPALLELDASGQPVFAKSFPDSMLAQPSALAADASGDIYLAGFTTGEADFDGSAQPSCIQESSTLYAQQAYLAKLDARGNRVWSSYYGPCAGESHFVYVGVDSDGNVLAAGETAVDSDPSNRQGTVLKLDASGAVIWTRDIPGVLVYGARVDPVDGSVLFGGVLAGPADFGKGTVNPTASSDLFFARLAANNEFVWSQVFPGAGNMAYAFSLDAQRNIIVTGEVNSVDFGQGTLGTGHSETAFAAEFDHDGQFRWAHLFDGGSETVQSAVDASGNSFFTVTTPNDIPIVELDASGKVAWTDRVTSTDTAYPLGAVLTDLGSLVIAGIFLGDVTFSEQFGSAMYANAQPGLPDIFVAATQHP